MKYFVFGKTGCGLNQSQRAEIWTWTQYASDQGENQEDDEQLKDKQESVVQYYRSKEFEQARHLDTP